ncbi:hypothetical protein Tco_0563402 [Tanacetum coccineum]
MVAFLEKSTGSEGFHQVIDFLNQSHICYALTKKPDVYISFIKQFWRSAEATNDDNGEVQLTATIDGHSMTITEASLRRHLKLDDHDGITSIPNSEIFEQLALMGYHTDSDKLTFQKVFNNMKRPTKGYSSQEIALFPTMLNVSKPSTSPSRITSSPSHSPEPSPSHSHEPSIEHSPDHTTAAVSFPSPTQPTQPSPGAEQHIPTPHDLPLHAVYSHGSDEDSLKLIELTNLVTKLSKRIGILEDDLKKTKLTYSTAVTKLILRVKKLEAQVKAVKARKGAREKESNETKPIIEEVTPTEVIQDQGSSKKGNSEVSTARATKGTASEVPVISTTKENISTARRTVTYRRRIPVISTAEENISTAGRTVTYKKRSEEERTRKDKGKAIMTKPEPKKKSKKEIEQEIQWDEEERQRATSEAKSTKEIDWNDPSVIRYHALKMKLKTVAQARRNMDFNQHIEPMEHGSEKMKSPEKIEEEDVDTQKEMKEVSKESGAKRKKSLPRKSTRSTVKRQKMEEETEKEDLKGYLDIVPREEFAEDVESLSTKYPIVDWKTCVLTENFMYYQIFRGDGSSKNYKVLSEMLEDFDRQDVMDLYRLVKERYSASRPEGYDLMLWGDLHTLFES